MVYGIDKLLCVAVWMCLMCKYKDREIGNLDESPDYVVMLWNGTTKAKWATKAVVYSKGHDNQKVPHIVETKADDTKTALFVHLPVVRPLATVVPNGINVYWTLCGLGWKSSADETSFKSGWASCGERTLLGIACLTRIVKRTCNCFCERTSKNVTL